METRRDWGRTLVVVSAALVVLAATATLFLPTGTEASVSSVPEDGEPAFAEISERSTSLAGQILDGEEDGFVVLVLLVPVAVALGAVALDRTRRRRASRAVAAVLLAGFTLLALASVGVLFLPGAAALLAAAFVPDPGPA